MCCFEPLNGRASSVRVNQEPFCPSVGRESSGAKQQLLHPQPTDHKQPKEGMFVEHTFIKLEPLEDYRPV